VASSADALALRFVEKVALAAKKKKYASESPSTREVKHSEMEKYTGYGQKKKASKTFFKGLANRYQQASSLTQNLVNYGAAGAGLAGVGVTGGYLAANKLVDDSVRKAKETASGTLKDYALPAIAALTAASGLGSYLGGRGGSSTGQASPKTTFSMPKMASLMSCLDIYEKAEGTPLQKEAALLLVDCLLDRE
tara:strand:- start:1524 stop:2102 length:579 start_codon:yes stop_codon:yes gene_type:complete